MCYLEIGKLIGRAQWPLKFTFNFFFKTNVQILKRNRKYLPFNRFGLKVDVFAMFLF
jgi:hypothetical protein